MSYEVINQQYLLLLKRSAHIIYNITNTFLKSQWEKWMGKNTSGTNSAEKVGHCCTPLTFNPHSLQWVIPGLLYWRMAEYSPQSYNFLCLLIYQLVTCLTKAKTQRRYNLLFSNTNAKKIHFKCVFVGRVVDWLVCLYIDWLDWLIDLVDSLIRAVFFL